MLAFIIATPPLAEQQVIVSHIGQAAKKCDALIAEAESAIALLQERRAALISAAVTGKIDVRERGDLVAAMAGSARDIAAGRFVIESAQAHVARIQASLKRDD